MAWSPCQNRSLPEPLEDQFMLNPRKLFSVALFIVWLPLTAAAASNLFIEESFSSDPATRGWGIHGSAGLFHWNDTNQNLEVTWNSAEPTSYFYLPLGSRISSTNDFLFSFDLRMKDLAVGTTPGNPWSFQIAVSLLNYTNATNTVHSRAAGFFPDVVEFNFFPYAGGIYGPGVYATAISSAGDFSSGGFTEWIDLETNRVYHVEMRYYAEGRRLAMRMSRDGQPVGPLQDAVLGATFGDFQLDTLAISSYNDTVPWEGGSVLAHGAIDNLTLITPPPIDKQSGSLSHGEWEARFASKKGWNYQLKRSVDLKTWKNTGAVVPGTGETVALKDSEPPAGGAFYRVQAVLP